MRDCERLSYYVISSIMHAFWLVLSYDLLEHQWHTQLIVPCATFCSYHILTSSVIYYWTDARQHGIYFLNRHRIIRICILSIETPSALHYHAKMFFVASYFQAALSIAFKLRHFFMRSRTNGSNIFIQLIQQLLTLLNSTCCVCLATLVNDVERYWTKFGCQ